jgi:arylsulfatase A-like enzyme
MGHRYGDSEKFYDAVKMMDDQIGRLWEAIHYRTKNFNEDWVIYITTDHGRGAETGKNHGGQSDRERNTWIVTNAKDINSWFTKHPPGIVDIMPSLAAHLDLTIPREQLMEIDGVNLTGKIAAADLNATLENNKLAVTWKAIDKKAKAKIWLATSNEFKTGGHDNYTLASQTDLSAEKAVIKPGNTTSPFYKIVLETSTGFLNRWVIRKP